MFYQISKLEKVFFLFFNFKKAEASNFCYSLCTVEQKKAVGIVTQLGTGK
jgi:hypothetical protein